MDFDFSVFGFKAIGLLTPGIQIAIVAGLFLLTTAIQFREYLHTGTMWTYFPPRVSMLFVPIYEEALFRGLILGVLLALYSQNTAIIGSSVLFGLWHVKNVFWMPVREVGKQVIYTSLLFGPAMAYLTIATGTIWLAVILHYLNNILAPYSQSLVSKGYASTDL